MSLSSRIADFVEQFRVWVHRAPSLDTHNFQLQSNNWSYCLSNICHELQTNPVPAGDLGLLKVLVPAFGDIYSKSPEGPIDLKYIKQVIESYDEGIRCRGQSNTPVPVFFQLPEDHPATAPAPAPAPVAAPAAPPPSPPPAAPPAPAAPAPAPVPATPVVGPSLSPKRKADKVGDDADEPDHPGKKPRKPRSKSVRASSVKPDLLAHGRSRKSAAFIEDGGEAGHQSTAAVTAMKLPLHISKSPAATSRKRPPPSDKKANEGEKTSKVNNPPCNRCRAADEECRTYSNSKGCFYCMKVAKQRCSLVQQSTGRGRGKKMEPHEMSGEETVLEAEDKSDMKGEAAVPFSNEDTRSRGIPMDVDVLDPDMNVVQPARANEVAMIIRPAPPHQYPIPSAIPGPAAPAAITHMMPTLPTFQGYMERIENIVSENLTRCAAETRISNEELRGELRRMEQGTFNRILSMWEDVAKMNFNSVYDLLGKLQLLIDKAKRVDEDVPQPHSTLQPSHPEGHNEGALKEGRSSGQRRRSHSEAGPNTSVTTPLPPVNVLSSKPNSRKGEATSAAISMREIVNMDMCLQENEVGMA